MDTKILRRSAALLRDGCANYDTAADHLDAAAVEIDRLKVALMPAYVEPAENGRDLVMTDPVRDHVFGLRDEVERLEGTETNLIALLRQHGDHWRAVADALGSICCGGVDGPVSDPCSTAGVIIAEVKRLMAENAALAAQVAMKGENYKTTRTALERCNNVLATVRIVEMDPADESGLAQSQIALFDIALIINWCAQELEAAQLWCVHIEGPDDIIAMRTKEKAEAEAAKINAFMKRQPDFDDDPHVEAKAIPYTGSAENHAAEVEANEAEERISNQAAVARCAG